MITEFVDESLRTPVVGGFDVCVIGGSCTGAFAAIRAARHGANVALVEAGGFLGGVATAGLVNVWHSLFDTSGERRIVAGLTEELIERLKRRGAVTMDAPLPRWHTFNPAEMILELDRMVGDTGKIRPFLHTRFVKPTFDAAGRITHAIIEDKTGRRALQAKCFVDASGDGDLVHRAGFPTRRGARLQPSTTGAVVGGVEEVLRANPGLLLDDALSPRFGGGFKHIHLWDSEYVGLPGLRFLAMPSVEEFDCSDADGLTAAEIEGRRQLRSFFDVVRKNFREGDKLRLATLSSYIGVRETRRCEALHRLTEMEVLNGERFDDAIANGSYCVDIHDEVGVTFKRLDGSSRVQRMAADGKPEVVHSRWRPDTGESPTFYQIPYRCLVPKGSRNALCAGRVIDAGDGAFGAIRVMVNCNQTGEAAGLAAALCAASGEEVATLDTALLRTKLAAAGALII